MSKFTDTVNQDTPRLVVMFKHEDGVDKFVWGLVGKVPLSNLIGCIVRVQSELYFRAAEECPESALVIAWEVVECKMRWFIHPSIPVDSMVGMLDIIKYTILNTQAARSVANQQIILGPDGQPMRR